MWLLLLLLLFPTGLGPSRKKMPATFAGRKKTRKKYQCDQTKNPYIKKEFSNMSSSLKKEKNPFGKLLKVGEFSRPPMNSEPD